eukprot:CAMPEP_0195513020 /NCGR_PEP_ID=MMETSP0794_2-20130614/4775_1 /TAXON_ID=515487 /ORGANISM="Stephanopyxis turris, Strain CCMP 815" /LENGTH=525 /DNA_ID=CAMNT_0040640931 /DNA_START=87 /DNA_END=1664 /DNA_ORIENTATION=+
MPPTNTIDTPEPDESMQGDFATLTLPDGKEHKIKIHRGTACNTSFLDIQDLFAKTGCFTYDPGFGCTASCSSSITWVDGKNGICLYRGYPIGDLCQKSNFLEVAYLLMMGELPTAIQLENFVGDIKVNLLVHEKLKRIFDSFQMDAHPMAIMVAVVGALSAFFPELNPHDPLHRWLAGVRILAKFPTLAAISYKTSIGEPTVYPRGDLTFSENFLHMMFATPLEPYKVNPIHAKAIDTFLILHADHEQNASTSTVRIAGSSMANPYACIAAGIASLWGPAHGGANEAVINMLTRIGSKENIPAFLENVKQKKERLMGFGHRVYKAFDPRAKAMKILCKQVLSDLDSVDPQVELATELERIALEDEYFVKRNLYPNVDFYSGIVLRAMGIPTSMYTVMFAMARCIGWFSQWNEMIHQDRVRIGRPRQLYTGVKQRDFVDLQDRVPSDDEEAIEESEERRLEASMADLLDVQSTSDPSSPDRKTKTSLRIQEAVGHKRGGLRRKSSFVEEALHGEMRKSSMDLLAHK